MKKTNLAAHHAAGQPDHDHPAPGHAACCWRPSIWQRWRTDCWWTVNSDRALCMQACCRFCASMILTTRWFEGCQSPVEPPS